MRISDWSSDVCSSDLGQQAKRDRAGADAVPRTQVQERPADESVGGAEQLQHADFLPPRLDVQAHRVAHHQQRAQAEQECQHPRHAAAKRSEEHTSELQSLMRISYAVFCLKKKTTKTKHNSH